MSNFDFDFGFTAVDESELEAVQTQTVAVKSYEEKVNLLYNAILPLLTNLKKNPEKEYIYWPNRIKKVEEFEDHIKKIVSS